MAKLLILGVVLQKMQSTDESLAGRIIAKYRREVVQTAMYCSYRCRNKLIPESSPRVYAECRSYTSSYKMPEENDLVSTRHATQKFHEKLL